ncbi:MAG: GtrA family protein [Oceanicaulis sp.]|nr:GtrA family protein [Oceanicaulis sp.]
MPNDTGGESKLDLKTAFDLGGLLMSRLTNSRLSPRFFLFSMVGMSGVLVHLVSMRFLLAAGFAMANFLAAITAMTSNYVINNSLTYRDRHKKGAEFIWGLMQFYGICALGLVANMAVATTVFHLGAPWWGAAIAGSAMGGVWNYATASRWCGDQCLADQASNGHPLVDAVGAGCRLGAFSLGRDGAAHRGRGLLPTVGPTSPDRIF